MESNREKLKRSNLQSGKSCRSKVNNLNSSVSDCDGGTGNCVQGIRTVVTHGHLREIKKKQKHAKTELLINVLHINMFVKAVWVAKYLYV